MNDGTRDDVPGRDRGGRFKKGCAAGPGRSRRGGKREASLVELQADLLLSWRKCGSQKLLDDPGVAHGIDGEQAQTELEDGVPAHAKQGAVPDRHFDWLVGGWNRR